ncbi:I78 family peptidase inhibitor [Sagittula sp. NFXS13]|uniref:I78 family peptidase inhibitor n=1 Tax=Sagittula sp. NFXS13 TaxID=2819095 RepID=UPI0032E01652
MIHSLAAVLIGATLLPNLGAPNGKNVLPVMGAQQSEKLPDATCPAGNFSDLVGQPASAAEDIPDPKRILPRGAMKTEDFRPHRTNVFLDENDLIERLNCG